MIGTGRLTKAAAQAMRDGTPPLADDLLRGADVIAEFIYGDKKLRKRVYYLHAKAKGTGRLPIFKFGATLCARRSTLLAWISEREGRMS